MSDTHEERIPSTLLIACGALAREIMALKRANRWDHVSVQCLPAELHNTPGKIPGAVRDRIRAARADFERIFVAYADCGTGGELDTVLDAEGVERIPGAHCYEFYAGAAQFEALSEVEPGTFYLTDFLTRHFDRLVIGTLGLDRHPELAQEYFRNYRRLVYLAQSDDPRLLAKAREAAEYLGLAFEHRHTGFGDLRRVLVTVAGEDGAQPQRGAA